MSKDNLIESLRECKRPLVIFGASIVGRSIYTLLRKLDINVSCFCDNFKTGEDPLLHVKIISPAQLTSDFTEVVVLVCVADKKIQNEIVKQLNEMNPDNLQLIDFDEVTSALSCYDFGWKDFDDSYNWNDHEYFIQKMAEWIDEDDKSVIDIGAGGCVLKRFLKKGTIYIPMDYIARTSEFVKFDFNADSFPDINADVLVLSNCICYVEPGRLNDLLSNAFRHSTRKVIISFNIMKPENVHYDYSKLHGVKSIFFSADEILRSAQENHFKVMDGFTIPWNPGKLHIYLFAKG